VRVVTVVRALPLPPDPLSIARTLARRPGLAVLMSSPAGAPRPDDARWSFVACDPDAESDALAPPGEGQAADSAPGWGGAPGGPRWIGVVPYDALRGIERSAWTRRVEDRPAPCLARPAWRRYPAVVRVDHVTGAVAVEAVDEGAATRMQRALVRSDTSAPAGFGLRMAAEQEPEKRHLERIRLALGLIAEGDLYQVNLARRIPMHLRGDRLSLFASLAAAAPAPWAFYQDLGDAVVCGTSPELALSMRGDRLRTCPIKGTRPRGRDAAEDGRMASELDGDPKERAELAMAVDVHRNDVGRVSVPGSVRAGEPLLMAGRTVWSRGAEVLGRRSPTSGGLDEVLRAMLPCGSVTGAPKVRAMEVIARLEASRRGAYTGALGYVGEDGSVCLAVAIRTLEIAKVEPEDAACYFAGGGIVADSVPEHELEETRWKAVQLESLGRW
jgi:anthranilate/para-aminobenzoate synthase component I